MMDSQTTDSVTECGATPDRSDKSPSLQWDLKDLIPKVARAISDDDQIERLGRALGFEYSDIKRFIRTNLMEGEVTTRGTKNMLMEWAETVSITRQQQALKDALREAGLVQICTFFQAKLALHSVKSPSLQWDLEDIIPKVARAISDDDQIERLGRELGFEYPDIKRFIRTNLMEGEVTTRGTKKMLREWAETVCVTRQQQALRDAIRQAGLAQIEKHCFPNQGHPSTPCKSLHNDELMSPEMKKFQRELKDTYCREYSMIKTSPLDPESEKRLQEIYVKLELILADEKKEEKKEKKLENKKKIPLEYGDLLNLIRTETESGLKTRFAFTGEAGVGKSTLLARIAFDWATGKCLQEIALLFLLPLREFVKRKYFGDIALSYVSDDIELEGKEVDEFIRNHQRLVLFLFDGLDESRMLLKNPDRDDAGVSILRGDRFRESAVIVTTRPSHVDQIKTNEKIRKQYTFVRVEGFTKENMAEYIRRFFEDDMDSSSSLIRFMQTNKVIAEHMAPYPIFCSMLCHLWKSKSTQDTMQKMKTYSQIMKEMVFQLQEQYSSKYSEPSSEDDYEDHMERTDEAMAKIGSTAFQGLLIKQLVFKRDEITSITEDAVVVCNLGILTKERKLLPREVRQREKKQFVDEFRFPHKLMQEFMAGRYLASLYHTDPSEFNRVLIDVLLRNHEDFRYVLYFTGAHEGTVGRSVMKALCQKVYDLDFIMEVAFEYQDWEAIEPAVNAVRRSCKLSIGNSNHSASGYLLTLERCGQKVMGTSSTPLNPASPSNVISANSTSSYAVAAGLFTLKSLIQLWLQVDLDDDFYTGMAACASQSQIKDWTHCEASLGPCASQQYARGLFRIPNLRLLTLMKVKLDDEFFSTMVDISSQSKIERWTHSEASLGSSASQQYARGLFRIPNLRILSLNKVKLDDEFFSTMVDISSHSKIQELALMRLALTRYTLHAFLSLPCLRSLSMGEDITCTGTDEGGTSVETSDFISSVDKLSIHPMSVDDALKLGLHTSCPRVHTLTIDSGSLSTDVLSSDTVSKACSSFLHYKILRIEWGSVVPASFCVAVMSSCPQLRILIFDNVELTNEMVKEIIHSLKTHPQLKRIEFVSFKANKTLEK